MKGRVRGKVKLFLKESENRVSDKTGHTNIHPHTIQHKKKMSSHFQSNGKEIEIKLKKHMGSGQALRDFLRIF